MDNQNAKNKKRIGLVAAVICCIALIGAGTLAYFTVEETAHNVITTGKVQMKLHEETADGKPFPENGITGVMPNTEVDKKVFVENTGNADMYVRICVDKSIQPADGVDAALDFKNITLDIDTQHWTEKDGFYYYNRALKPGEKTEPLFTVVQFGKELGNEYMDAKIEIDVNAQAVQSKNNGDNPLTAAGWPEM